MALTRAQLYGTWSDSDMYMDGFMECHSVVFRRNGSGYCHHERADTSSKRSFRWTVERGLLRLAPGRGRKFGPGTAVEFSRRPNALGRPIRSVDFAAGTGLYGPLLRWRAR